MPDYAACDNTECNRKDTCCRFLMEVRDDDWQTYLSVTGNGDDCEEYWPVEQGAPFRIKSIPTTPAGDTDGK